MRTSRWLFVIGALLLLVLQGCAGSGGRLADRSGPARLQDLGGGVCQDVATGLMWQVGVSERFATWEEAAAAAQGLAVGGHDDWRLPTSDELYTLHDLIEGKLTGDCAIGDKGLSFWSGESQRWSLSGYWETYPLCGGVDYKFVKQKGGVVRAVRP
ncbi:MAG: DUF1566 domain-containing protein [Desulfobulbaceae bacterium]|nr:DUF1566 domain-containing protein [Desulfobulbaceae bacterium]